MLAVHDRVFYTKIGCADYTVSHARVVKENIVRKRLALKLTTVRLHRTFTNPESSYCPAPLRGCPLHEIENMNRPNLTVLASF